MFAAEFEPAQNNGRRRSLRAPVSLDARIGRGGLDRALCKVTNISIHGAKLHTYIPLRKDSVIWLTLPKAGQVAATIIWADEFVAGCQFREALDLPTFEALVALGGDNIVQAA